MTKVGSLIKSRRNELGLTQGELAAKIGVGNQFLSNIERGVCPFPWMRLHQLAKYIKTDRRLIARAMTLDYAKKLEEE